MRRMLLASLFAATIGVPGAAFAVQTTGMNTNSPTPNNTLQWADTQNLRDRHVTPHQQPANGSGAAIGAGMDGGSLDGHTTGPGTSQIDDSVRGPINDVQPGRGTSDTLQNRNPKPVRELPAQ